MADGMEIVSAGIFYHIAGQWPTRVYIRYRI